MIHTKKNVLICAICLIACTVITFILMFTARFSYVVKVEGEDSYTEVISNLEGITLAEFFGAMKDTSDDFEKIQDEATALYDEVAAVYDSKDKNASKEINDLKSLVSNANSVKTACTISQFAVRLIFFFMILCAFGAFGVIPHMLRSNDDIQVGDLRTFDTLLWISPLLLLGIMAIPLIAMESFFVKTLGRLCSVRFEFVGGVNFLYIAIGAFILPKLCRFICRRFL